MILGRIIKDEKLENYCSNCVNSDGSLKSFDEVWGNLAKYLRETQGLDERASINAAKVQLQQAIQLGRKKREYILREI
ncbi:MAG: hypothetical protein R2883_05225 [Caldisericia bacterium]